MHLPSASSPTSLLSYHSMQKIAKETSHKKFSEWKQAHAGTEPSKTNRATQHNMCLFSFRKLICTYTRIGHTLCNYPTWTPAEFYVSLWVLMHWYTCKSLLNTLGRAVKWLAKCLTSANLAVKVKVQQHSQSMSASRMAMANDSANFMKAVLCLMFYSPFHISSTLLIGYSNLPGSSKSRQSDHMY